MISNGRWLGPLLVLGLVACGDDGRRPPSRDGGGVDAARPDGGGVDAATGCTPGDFLCAGNVHYQCGPDGMSRMNEMVCEGACDPVAGCVACMPGQQRCEGTVSMVCASDGSGFVTARDCAENGATCGSSGYCGDACGAAESSRSNIGCEYWAAPLPNGALDLTQFDYRLVVANPDATSPANVRVFRGGSMVQSVTVAPGGLQEIVLPWIEALTSEFAPEEPPSPLDPPPPPSWGSPAVPNGAYRVLADRPVTVAEFNPFEYEGATDFSYTNDASLLLPAHSYTGNYIGSSYPSLSLTREIADLFGTQVVHGSAPSYIALIGVTPEPTTVQVSVPAPVAAATDGRFSALSPGGTANFTIQRGEVVVIAAQPTPQCTASRPGHRFEPGDPLVGTPDTHYCNEAQYDLTGARVTANHPIAVFGGHDCAFVPYDRFACDHLENQLPPLETWGRNFVTGPMGDPGPNLRNVVRVVAARDGTNVTIDPPQGGVSTMTLNAGQWREFDTTSPFSVSATDGIMVSQFLVGQNASDPPAERGDPAMVVLPPREQYRRDYTFVTPSSYNPSTMGQSYLLVVRPPGLDITLDGGNLSGSWTTVGDREVAIIPVDGGTHQMSAADTFGVIVYGMGQFTSYAYPAGLNLEEILLI